MFPSSLKPDTWNSFCLKVNSTRAVINLNGETFIIHKDECSSFSAYSDSNSYIFMNSEASPMYGAITDLNVWNMILSDDESENWMNCTSQREGNVFSWQNSSQHIELTGLKKVSDSSDNTCLDKTSHLIVGKEIFNFEGTLNYCNKVGNLVVISSKEIAHKVNKTLELFAPDSYFVYTGHTDIEEEGRWVVHGTQQEMAWNNWAPGRPNDLGDCAIMETSSFRLYDDRADCQRLSTPVCNLTEVAIQYKFLTSLPTVATIQPSTSHDYFPDKFVSCYYS